MASLNEIVRVFLNPTNLISGVIFVGLTFFVLWLIHGRGKNSPKL